MPAAIDKSGFGAVTSMPKVRVALSLDRSNWPEIVGTISGDDTIFVATKTAGDQKQLLSKLRSLQH